ncbi:TetR/AcrR family transcriptional regulator [Leifsonia poae]|uniref:TetR family transcriptional regulator n=2 Tax=Leifsonia poae TaxID=110933 RepID=A0A9W6HAH6_9MICO|nr:TetR family transcriptional regulator [Leifsonia poae]
MNRGRSAGPENRRALIAAAREVFAEGGFAAPLSAVARRAGVGQGSLYRHFPDRIALALAVFDDNITDLEALRDRPDARMSDLFDEISEQAIASTALIDMISTERHDPRAEELGARVSAVVDAVLVRDQDAGRIRASVTGGDVMLAVSMLAFLLSRTDHDERPAIAERARRIFREGFATDPDVSA